MGLSECALEEAGGALIAVWVNAERKLASRSGEGNLIVLAGATLHSPVVIAVIVHGPFTVEKQTVLALFEGQCSWKESEEKRDSVEMTVEWETKEM